MRRLVLPWMAILACGVSIAEPGWRHGEREPLWPEGKIPDFQEHQIGEMSDEMGDGFRPEAHRMPYIEWFEKPANPNGGCMILVSGGAYHMCCDVDLIREWRDTFTRLGYQTVNLVYRTPRPKGLPVHQSAWEDGQRAVRIVRSQAKARGFDPEKIGVIGMSAGGHLVTLLATSALTPAYEKVDALDGVPCHVNWCIADAPAYNTMNGAGGDQSPKDGVSIVPKINPCFKFDAKTCPISFHHGGLDPWSPNGSTLCYRELRKRGVPSELHLYADRTHGAHGIGRAVEFLNQMGFTGKLEDEVDQDRRFMPGATLRTEKESLWPRGRIPDVSPNHEYEPYLVWFVPEKLTTNAIQVIVPGGGYGFCNFNGEGTPVAHYLNGKGMTAVVVMYRCPRPVGRPKYFSAWQDAQRAIRIVRSEAPGRGLDPDRIGLMGFSAGGHLALMTATNAQTPAYEPIDDVDRFSCKLQWACPICPAYVLTDGGDSPNNGGGNDDSAVLVPEFSFDDDTPPMCFVHGDADAWAAMNSVKCWEKLRTMGIQSDLHTLAGRGHSFQVRAAPGTGSYTWMDRVWDFLVRKGVCGREPKISVFADIVQKVAEKRKVTLEESAAWLYGQGVRGFDCGVFSSELERLSATQLKPVNLYYFPNLSSADLAREESSRAIDVAVKYGVPRLMVIPPNFTADGNPEVEFARNTAWLRGFVSRASSRGIEVSVEDFGNVRNACSQMKYLRRLIAEISDLRVTLDTGNLYFAGQGDDVREMVWGMKDRIAHVHLKDLSGTNCQQFVSLGLGAVPNKYVVNELRALEYDGWYTIENVVGEPDEDVRRQIDVLRSWFAGEREPMRVTLTFDDSLKDHLLVAAPFLERHGWRGTFNIVTDWVGKNEKFLTWDDVRELVRRGHEVTTHTVSHAHLVQLLTAGKTNEVRRQISVSRDLIAAKTGFVPRYMCAPFIEQNGDTARICREEGLAQMSVPRHIFGGDNQDDVVPIVRDYRNRGARRLDVLHHGVSAADHGGWCPFRDRASFARHLDCLAELEKRGVIVVTDYADCARQ